MLLKCHKKTRICTLVSVPQPNLRFGTLKMNWVCFLTPSADVFTHQQQRGSGSVLWCFVDLWCVCWYLDVHRCVITLLLGFIQAAQVLLQRNELFLHLRLIKGTKDYSDSEPEILNIYAVNLLTRGIRRTCCIKLIDNKLQLNMNASPSGPEPPLPGGTLGVPGASWMCDTHSKGLQSRPDRRVWGLPRVWCTSPPLSPPAPPAPRPLVRLLVLVQLLPCAPAPSGRCRPRSSAPGWRWAPSGSTSSCRWDIRVSPSSCSRTAAGRLGRSCGCTWAPRGPWRSRSRRDRTAPPPAWSPNARKQPEVEGPKPPWDSGGKKVFQAERKHVGAAPWFLLAGGNFLLQLWYVFSERPSLNAAGVLSELDTVYEQPGLQIGRDSKNRFPSLLVNKGSRHNPHLPAATRFFENIQVELEGEGSEHLHHVLIIWTYWKRCRGQIRPGLSRRPAGDPGELHQHDQVHRRGSYYITCNGPADTHSDFTVWLNVMNLSGGHGEKKHKHTHTQGWCVNVGKHLSTSQRRVW